MLVGCLGAADEKVLVTLCGHNDGPVGLEVKVLLPAELDGALHHMVRSCTQTRNAKTFNHNVCEVPLTLSSRTGCDVATAAAILAPRHMHRTLAAAAAADAAVAAPHPTASFHHQTTHAAALASPWPHRPPLHTPLPTHTPYLPAKPASRSPDTSESPWYCS